MYLQMKALSLPQLCALVITGAGSLAFTLPCVAGDKIIVSEEKTQADPNKDRIGNDLFKAKLKLDQSPFDNSILGLPTFPRANPSPAYSWRRQSKRLGDR